MAVDGIEHGQYRNTERQARTGQVSHRSRAPFHYISVPNYWLGSLVHWLWSTIIHCVVQMIEPTTRLCASIEGEPSANVCIFIVTPVWPFALMTLTHWPRYTNLTSRYSQCVPAYEKWSSIQQRFQKLEHKQHKQKDRQTWPNALPAAFAVGDKEFSAKYGHSLSLFIKSWELYFHCDEES